MRNTITVRHMLFRADIYLDRLEDMPLRNFQRLLRIAAKDPQLNEEAIQLLREHFERQVPEARTVMQTAAKAYLDAESTIVSADRIDCFPEGTDGIEYDTQKRTYADVGRQRLDVYKRQTKSWAPL